MRLIDADRFLKWLIFKGCIDKVLCKEIAEAIEKCKVIPDKWIPVSERLPNKYGYYLVTKKKIRNYGLEDVVEIAQYTIGCQWKRCDSKVIAWMPLPKPYKVESEDKE